MINSAIKIKIKIKTEGYYFNFDFFWEGCWAIVKPRTTLSLWTRLVSHLIYVDLNLNQNYFLFLVN